MIDNKEFMIEKLSIEEQKDFQSFIEERKEQWKTWKPFVSMKRFYIKLNNLSYFLLVAAKSFYIGDIKQ